MISELEKRVLSYIDEDEVVGFLQAILRCNSCYPPGNTLSVADVCKKKLQSEQIEVELAFPVH